MHGLEAEYWGRVDFVYLDREDPNNQSVVQTYGVVYQPELVFVAPDGTVIEHWFGFNEGTVRSALDGYLAATGG